MSAALDSDLVVWKDDRRGVVVKKDDDGEYRVLFKTGGQNTCIVIPRLQSNDDVRNAMIVAVVERYYARLLAGDVQ
jgi:hypothetical protein